MASRFLTGRRGDEFLWACIDPLSLCTSPAIGERRFVAYLSPYIDEQEARQALLEAGADSATRKTAKNQIRRCYDRGRTYM